MKTTIDRADTSGNWLKRLLRTQAARLLREDDEDQRGFDAFRGFCDPSESLPVPRTDPGRRMATAVRPA
jgi:hypothetical protein